jgi:hypothetical protein
MMRIITIYLGNKQNLKARLKWKRLIYSPPPSLYRNMVCGASTLATLIFIVSRFLSRWTPSVEVWELSSLLPELRA